MYIRDLLGNISDQLLLSSTSKVYYDFMVLCNFLVVDSTIFLWPKIQISIFLPLPKSATHLLQKL